MSGVGCRICWGWRSCDEFLSRENQWPLLVDKNSYEEQCAQRGPSSDLVLILDLVASGFSPKQTAFFSTSPSVSRSMSKLVYRQRHPVALGSAVGGDLLDHLRDFVLCPPSAVGSTDRSFPKNGRMPGGAGRRTSTSFEAINASSATGISNLVR